MRKFMVAVAIVLVFLVLIILMLPFLLDLNRYRDQFLPGLEEAIDRKIEVEDVRLTLFPTLGVHLQNLVIADDPTFSSQPFMNVPSVQVVVRWKPLLQRRVQVKSVVVEAPIVQVIRATTGELSTSTMGKVSSPGTASGDKTQSKESVSPLFGVFAVEQFTVNGGTLDYEDRMQQPSQAYQIHGLKLSTDSVAIGETARIGVNGMLMPFQIPFDVKGKLGPIQGNLDIPEIDIRGNASNVALTAQGNFINGQLTLDVQVPKVSTDDVPIEIELDKPVELSQLHAHLVAFLVPKERQIRPGEVTIDPIRGNLRLGSSAIHLSGKGTPSHFSLVGDSAILASQDLPVALPVHQPFLLEQIQFETELQGAKLSLRSFKAKAFDGVFRAQGMLDRAGPPFRFSTQGTFKDFSIDSLVKVVRPSSIRMTGVGELEWKLTGITSSSQPLKLRGPAHLTVGKGEVLGWDLVKTVEAALQMPGVLGKSTGTTKFSLIEAKTEFDNDGLAIRKLTADASNFSLRSAGKVGLDQSVNLQGTLEVPPAIAEKIIRRFPMANVARQEGRFVLPFVVRGTIQDPKFRLDTQLLGNQVKKKIEKRLERALQGDNQELQKLLDDGKDLLKQFFRK